MTSKEALEMIELKKTYHPDLPIDEEINIIKQDLEVLDEIKKECKKNLFVSTTLKVNPKIKEWLENGN